LARRTFHDIEQRRKAQWAGQQWTVQASHFFVAVWAASRRVKGDADGTLGAA